MCIICYKPEGAVVPPRGILENCFYSNPDGAGYAIWRKNDNFVTYKKGFFSFEELYGDFMAESVALEDRAALHFRIATHGAVIAGNCHPFPVSADVGTLQSSEGFCKSVLFHNGILGAKYAKRKDFSDTMAFTIGLAKKESSLIKSGKLLNFIEKETEGSRILYFNARENSIIKSGNWVHDKETGCYFSNYSFDYYDVSPYFGKYYTGLTPVCPQCGGAVTHISTINDIWECQECGALCDSDGEEMELYTIESSLKNYYRNNWGGDV